MNDQWIPVTEKPLIIDRGNNFWEVTADGDKEFLAAVPYYRKSKGGAEMPEWWIRHCVIEEGRLCVVDDTENNIAGWEASDVTHWQPIPAPPQTPQP